MRSRRRISSFWLYALLLSTLLVVLIRGYDISGDAGGYIEGNIYRTPVYPLLIALARGLFGGAGIGAVFVLQNLIALTGVASMTLYLRRALSMPSWVAVLTTLLLLRPFFESLNIGNRILTEALAYGLFLLATRSLLEGLLRGDTRRLLISFAWTGLAVITRPQLVFLYPVIGLVVIYLSLSRRQVRRAVILTSGFVVMIAAAGLADRGYHLLRHGSFSRAPFVGIQLMVPALYHAQPGDLELLEKNEADLVRDVLWAARDKGLLSDSNPERPLMDYARHYARSYNEIVWRTMMPRVRERHPPESSARPGTRVAEDRWMLSTATRLIRARPGAYAKLYLSNVLGSLGLYYGALIFVVFGIALHRGLRLGEPPALALALASMLHFANLGVVALVEPILSRYSFYTDVLYLALLIVFIASRVPSKPTIEA